MFPIGARRNAVHGLKRPRECLVRRKAIIISCPALLLGQTPFFCNADSLSPSYLIFPWTSSSYETRNIQAAGQAHTASTPHHHTFWYSCRFHRWWSVSAFTIHTFPVPPRFKALIQQLWKQTQASLSLHQYSLARLSMLYEIHYKTKNENSTFSD